MGKRHFVLILSVILILFTLTAVVSAQDVDLENMDREQLLLLIQMIQDRLMADPAAESTPEPEGPVIPTATPTPELKVFSIYENKKLMIEALPGYMFVQPDNGNDGDDNDTGPTVTKTPTPQCPDGCSWFCPPQPSVLACGCWCG